MLKNAEEGLSYEKLLSDPKIEFQDEIWENWISLKRVVKSGRHTGTFWSFELDLDVHVDTYSLLTIAV